MKQKKIILHDTLITYYTSGAENSDAPPFIFLHGWRSSGSVWNKIGNQMSEIGNRIFMLDLPGFGGSETPKKPWTLDDYVKIIQLFISNLQSNLQSPISNLIIIGHSFGGRIAIKYAAQHPSELQKLILVDAAGIQAPSCQPPAFKCIAKIFKPFFKPRFMQPLRKKIYHWIGAEDYLATPELQKTFINIINEDLASLLQKISVPTLIVWGKNDTVTPLANAHTMHKLIPRSKLVTIPNAGHFSFLDQPEEFTKSLKEFLQK